MNKCLRNQWLTGWLATFCCLSFSASVFAQSSSKPTGNRQPARSTARPAPRPTAPQATNARPVQPMPAPALPGITQKPVSVLEANARPAQSAATNGAGQAKAGMFVLQHRLRPGNVVRTRTIHQANTVTRIQGTEDVSESNTVSDKVWDVKSLSPEGLMTFEYRIDAVDMSQKQSNKPEITYNSRTDKTAPEMFSRVAETISKPIAMVTIDATGKVIERDNQSKTPALGMGELAIPLPKDPVAIGAQWSIPRETRVKLEDGTHKTMKLREQYTLEKVSAGVATIKVETTPLTPVDDSSVESQLMQQMSRGTIKFDMDKGRLISKQLDWDDEVVGFRGAETALKYSARFTEESLDEPSNVSALPAATKR